jgi:hypothetical protein
MGLFHYTIASLVLVIALIGVDFAWLSYILLTKRSLLGLAHDGCDMVVLPMTNVLTFGRFRLTCRPGKGRRFWVGFELSGLAALLAIALCLRLAPDAMSAAFGAVFDPI